MATLISADGRYGFAAAGVAQPGDLIIRPDGTPAILEGLESVRAGDLITPQPLFPTVIVDFPSASGTTFAVGADVYWDSAAKLATATASGNSRVGKAVRAKSAGQLSVLVNCSASGSTIEFLLDVLPGATFAGGVIRLASGYAGTVAKAGATDYALSGDAIASGANGASISELVDQAGGSTNFAQASAPNRPSVAADSEGVLGLRFGLSGATALNSSMAAINQPCTIYLLASSDNAFVSRLFDSQSTGNYALLKNGEQWKLYNADGEKAGGYGGMIGVEKFALVLNGAASYLRIGNQVIGPFNTTGRSFDAGLRVGAASNMTQPLDGTVYAVAVYPVAHSLPQVQTAFDKLAYPVALPPLLLVDGDSIAYGTALGTTAGHIENRIAAKFLADGITIAAYDATLLAQPGQRLDQNTDYGGTVLARCVSTRKCVVVLNQGTNDLSFGSSAAAIAALMETYWAAAKSTGAVVVANTIIARGGGAAHTAPQEAQRLLLNTAIRASATPQVICDFGGLPEFDQQSDTGGAAYADAVHPSDAGTILWANAMYPALKAAAGF